MSFKNIFIILSGKTRSLAAGTRRRLEKWAQRNEGASYSAPY